MGGDSDPFSRRSNSNGIMGGDSNPRPKAFRFSLTFKPKRNNGRRLELCCFSESLRGKIGGVSNSAEWEVDRVGCGRANLDWDSTEMRGGLNSTRFVEFVGLELFGKSTQESGQGRSSFVRSAPWFAQRVPEISRSYAHCHPRTDPSP